MSGPSAAVSIESAERWSQLFWDRGIEERKEGEQQGKDSGLQKSRLGLPRGTKGPDPLGSHGSSWTPLHFKETLVREQEQSIPVHRKTSKYSRRPAWLSKKLQ